MIDFLREILSGSGFMPHGHCYLWTPSLVRLHVVSDALIVLAYYSIPITLITFVRKRKDLSFSWMFVCFAVFILACGTTHLLEIWNVWHSAYWLAAGMKALTALASVPTAILLVRLVPMALALASPEQMRRANDALQAEIETRRRAEEQVKELNRVLEQRVQDRTAELERANQELQREMEERRIANEAVRQSEADFRASFHSSAVGQAQVEPESGRYLRVNARFCEIAGYSEEELLGMTFRDLTHPGDRVDDGAAHDRMVRGESTEIAREKRYLRKDGETVWISVNASLIRDESGRPLRTLAVVQDITPRKRAEEAARESQQLLRAIVDNSAAVVYVKDLEGRYLLINRHFERVFGVASQDAMGKTDFDFFPREQAEAFRAVDRQVIASRSEQEAEEVADQADGPHTFLSVKCPLFGADGEPYAMCGISTDITERKRNEDAVRESEARKTAIMESALDCIITADQDGHILEFNPAARKAFGYTLDEVIGREIADVIIPHDMRAGHRRGLAHYRATGEGPVLGKRIEVMALRGDGTEFPVELAINAIQVKGQPMFTAYLRDITERRKAEAALRESEARFSKAFQANPAPMCITVISSGRFIEVNERYCQLFDHSREELIGKTSPELKLWAEPTEREAMVERLKAHGFVHNHRTYFRRKNGNIIDAIISMESIDFPGEKEPVVISMFADITERVRAEERLRASEERLRLITNLVPHGIFAKDAKGRYLFVNQALAEGCGMTVEEVLTKTDFDLVRDPAQAEAYLADDREVIETGRPKFIAEELNTDLSGQERIFQTTKVPFTVPETGEPAVLGVSVDISDRKRAEQEIQRLNVELEKRVEERTAELEAANRELEAFSYSVSHDLRAPLRAVDGFSQALMEDYGAQLPEDGQRYLRTIRKGAQGMGLLIDDLLAFSRLSRVPLSKRPVNMHDLVGEVITELSPQFYGRKVDIDVKNLPPCQGDPALVRQVWVNLLSNAFKYTRRRETAVITVGFDAAQEAYWVKDNGAGFDMRYADKLFGVFQRLHRAEDFEGTGVGLAIVQRVVHRHGGRIWAEGALDQGATFHFTLSPEPNS